MDIVGRLFVKNRWVSLLVFLLKKKEFKIRKVKKYKERRCVKDGKSLAVFLSQIFA